MTLGEKIQVLRKQMGLSQEQLAEKITISRQAISRWELNESIPDVENILQLSKVFSVSTDYLLTESALYPDNSENEDIGSRTTSSSSGSRGITSYTHEMIPIRGRKIDPLRWLRKFSLMCGIASPGIYLILGFWFGWWHPGWLIFIVPWLVYSGCMAAKYSP